MAGILALKRGPVAQPTNSPSPTPQRSLVISQPVKASVREPLKPEIPVKLFIPIINLEANIFPVGLTPTNIVDTPADDVGWYGVKPGEVGSAVFNGHVTGIFNKLSFLKTGDEVTVLDGRNQRFSFKVVRNQLVNVEDFPISDVYGLTQEVTLKLVTCAGDYDAVRSDFKQRTIIYTQLAE